MELRYGIISTAAITKRFIGAVQAINGKIEAIASRDIQKAQDFCKEYSISKAYGSYEELYQDDEVNVVYIATINAQHYEEIKKAIHYGKHVLCEKPITLSKQETEEVFKLAKEVGVFVMEMQKSIFLPITDIVKKYIDTQEMGKLHQVDMSASFIVPKDNWMFDATQGGVIYGSATYTIEYLYHLLNPTTTTYQVLGHRDTTGTITRASMNFKMDDILINSRLSMDGVTTNYATFYFEEGYIIVPEYWKARRCEIHRGTEVEIIEKPVTFEMLYELQHVSDCIEKGLLQSPIMDAQKSIVACEIVEYFNDKIG